jgi:orotate phosphoribosyltransferase
MPHDDNTNTNTTAAEIDTLALIFAANAQLPPAGKSHFIATSGAHLRYYLNLSTNLMLPTVARLTTLHMKRMIHTAICDVSYLPRDADIYCIGPETVGGILVSQVCCDWNEDDARVTNNVNFIYLRKNKKKTGTRQQIEGPQFITSRDSNSPVAYGVWLDDVISTGNSLLNGTRLLKKEYNVQMVGAIFLVDRSSDRNSSSNNDCNNPLNHADLQHVSINALMDERKIKAHLSLRKEQKVDSWTHNKVDDVSRRYFFRWGVSISIVIYLLVRYELAGIRIALLALVGFMWKFQLNVAF